MEIALPIVNLIFRGFNFGRTEIQLTLFSALDCRFAFGLKKKNKATFYSLLQSISDCQNAIIDVGSDDDTVG